MKIFVLSYHALTSSERSYMNFDVHEVVVPLSVLESTSKGSRQSDEHGKICRVILSKFYELGLDKLMHGGVILPNGGCLRIEKNFNEVNLDSKAKQVGLSPDGISLSQKRILQVCIGLREKYPEKQVILKTKNPELVFKARLLSIEAETYKDEILPSLSEQYTGRANVWVSPETFLSFAYGTICNDDIEVLPEFDENGNKISYFDYIYPEDILKTDADLLVNTFVTIYSNTSTALGIFDGEKIVRLNYNKSHPYGVIPRNTGQKFMLEAFLNPDISLAIVKGPAGTAKTFISLACALYQTTDLSTFERILITRPTETVDEDLGYLPGTEEEKLDPYLRGIKDNLSIIINSTKKTSKTNSSREDGSFFFEKKIIEAQAIGFFRGRSIVNSFIIIDEAQNLTINQAKTLITRAGEGSKIVLLGDIEQIDNASVTERNNGLSYVAERFKGQDECAVITMEDSESVRSNLARLAARLL